MRARQVWAAAVLVASSRICQPVAAADAALLEQVDVVPVGTGARVAVRFACPLRYLSHFPSTRVSEMHVSLTPAPGCALPESLDASRTAASGNAAGLVQTRLESSGSALLLSLDFERPVDVKVRPAPDSLGVEIVVIDAAAVERSTDGRAVQVAEMSRVPAEATRELPATEVLERQWQEARSAFAAADYATATRLLTRLIEYPEHVHRAESQELLGLSRERSHQYAHAKAEFAEYLRRYPDGAAAARVRQRLAALTTLDRRAADPVAERPPGMVWSAFGAFSQDYRHDATALDAGEFSQDFVSQSMIVTNADFSLRGRGERFDVQSRVNAGYMYDLLTDGPGDQARVSAAYFEIGDRQLALRGRLGRQSLHGGGVLGTFDGLHVGWGLTPVLDVNLTTGYALDTTRDPLSTDRQFVSLGADWHGLADGLTLSPFVISQRYGGIDDRQAVGGQVRWYVPGRTLVGLVDYDVDYGSVNLAMLLGSVELPGRWTLTGSVDHRNSPFLTTRNALIGQPVTGFGELVDTLGEVAVRGLAEDRTSTAQTASIGISHPVGDRFQWSADLAGSRISGTPASGGVPALPDMGPDVSFGTQLIANSLFVAGDAAIAGLRWLEGKTLRAISLALSSRFPLGWGLRIAPRLRVDQREFDADGSSQWVVGPSLRVDWHGRRTTVELEAGGEIASRDRNQIDEQTRRNWFSLGYWVEF
jgi:hypothetical protein